MDTADLVVAVLMFGAERKKDIQEEEYVKISDF